VQLSSFFQAFDAVLVVFDEIQDAAEALAIFGVAFGFAFGHLFDVVVHELDALREGFVAFGESFQAFVYVHGFLQYI